MSTEGKANDMIRMTQEERSIRRAKATGYDYDGISTAVEAIGGFVRPNVSLLSDYLLCVTMPTETDGGTFELFGMPDGTTATRHYVRGAHYPDLGDAYIEVPLDGAPRLAANTLGECLDVARRSYADWYRDEHSYDIETNPMGYGPERLALIESAIGHGCVPSDNASRLVTPDGLFDDANGHYLICLFGNAGDRMVDVWYEPFGQNQHGCGQFDASVGYEAVLDAVHDESGRCDRCGEYVGPDELNTVGFANKSCDKCLGAMREKLEYRGWTD